MLYNLNEIFDIFSLENVEVNKRFDNFQSLNLRGIGIDFGVKNIGIAVCDKSMMIATPLKIIQRKNYTYDCKEIFQIIKEFAINFAFIGWPMEMSGKEGETCEQIKNFITFFDEMYVREQNICKILADVCVVANATEIHSKQEISYNLNEAMRFKNNNESILIDENTNTEQDENLTLSETGIDPKICISNYFPFFKIDERMSSRACYGSLCETNMSRKKKKDKLDSMVASYIAQTGIDFIKSRIEIIDKY